MVVTVTDVREFPNYKNTPIITLIREIVAGFGSGSICWDDVGRTWATSFVPTSKEK